MLSCFIFFFSSLFSIYFMSIPFYLSYCYYTNKDRQKMSRLYFYPLSIFYRLTRQKNILSFFHILFFIIAFYKFNYYSQISWKFSLFLYKKTPRLVLKYTNRGYYLYYIILLYFPDILSILFPQTQ